MRVVVVHPGPAFSVADVHRGWVRALISLGCSTVDLNLQDRLSFYSTAGKLDADGEFVRMVDEIGAVRLASKGVLAVCYEFCPDVVLVISGFYLPVDVLDVIRARGSKVVLIHTESPYEDDRQVARASHADLNVVNDPTNIDRFHAVAPTMWLPAAYDPQVHHPGPPASPDHVSDFCFVGTGFPSRVAFLEQVDWAGIDVALAGHWQSLADDSPLRKYVAHDLEVCCDNDEAADLYRGAKMGANLYRKEADRPELSAGWAMGPREVELAACGLPFLRESRGEGDQVLSMLPTFTEPTEFEEKLRWWLNHDSARDDASHRAWAAVANRTFEANAKTLLTRLETAS